MKKGDYLEMNRDLRLAGTEGLQQGQIVRCERGGKNPTFSALMKLDGQNLPDLVEFSAPGSVMQRDAKPAQPVEDHVLLESIRAQIKTFPRMSEETLAMDGTIRIPGEKEIHVRNDGQGGSTMIQSYDQGRAVDRLRERLQAAVVDAGLIPKDPNSRYEDMAEEFVSFRTSTAGLETFASYLERSRALMAELFGKYDQSQQKNDLDEAMKGPGTPGSPGPKA